MQRFWITSALILVFVARSIDAWSHGITSRIVIEGDFLSSPIEITDPGIVRKFNIWNGPGVGMRDINQAPDLSVYVERERSVGRFIDWAKGVSMVRPSGLQRVQVTFYMGEHHSFLPYYVAYELDPTHSIGYIYLPRWNNSHLIWHGVEGHWYHAHQRWNELIMPIVLNANTEHSPTAKRADFSCKTGVGVIREDGSIEVRPMDRHGNYSARWAFKKSDPEYESVSLLFDAVEPDVETEVSCWPPRL